MSLNLTDDLYMSLRERSEKVLPGGNTRSTLYVPPHPPYVKYGDAYEIWDEHGNRLIDAQNNYTSLIHGHAHPQVVQAAADALRAGASFGLPTRFEIDLAEHLTGRFRALDRLRFTNSGTEAVMMAVRAARAFTGRSRVVKFEGAYHGTWDGVMDGAGILEPVMAHSVTLPFNDIGAFDKAIRSWATDTACVLLDLLPNRAGLIPAEQDFVDHLRAETHRVGALLIIDEVITGRLAYRGLHDEWGVEPDLITLGKVIGGGFPVGAFGGKPEIMASFDPRGDAKLTHGGTFNANPVTMRAGLAAMEGFSSAEVDRINDLGDLLRIELSQLGFKVTGYGSLARVHLGSEANETWWRLYREGVLIATNGLIALSTPMDEAVIEKIVRRFSRVIP